jgi:hypothetical protein
MTLTEAQTELNTIIVAIGDYITGRRRKRIKIMSAGVIREHEFSDGDKLFQYLITRRAELEAFIASLQPVIDPINSFTQNKNVPLVFKR